MIRTTKRLRSERPRATRAISDARDAFFLALANAVQAMEGRFQVIVTEHADELTWGGIEGVRLVANWRGDDYLIPPSWLPA